jgi:hypothetical protein
VPTIDSRGFAQAPGTTTSGIQEAVDAIPITGGDVEVVEGSFPITTALSLPKDRPVWIHGHGREATTITMASTSLDMLLMRGDYDRLSNLTLRGANAVGAGRGIVIGRPASDSPTIPLKGCVLEDVNIDATPTSGIFMRGTGEDPLAISILGRMTGVTVSNTKAGAGMDCGIGCTTWDFENCSFRRMVDNHVILRQCFGFNFKGGSLEEPLSIGGVRPWLLTSSCGGISLKGVWFEQGAIDDATNAMIFLNNGSNDGISVDDCTFSRKRTDGTALQSNIMVIGGTGGTPGLDTNVRVSNMVVTANGGTTPEITIDAACTLANILIVGGRCAARASKGLKVTDPGGIATYVASAGHV